MSGDKRLWQYKLGEARIFDSREAVPAGAGWQDYPAKEVQNGPHSGQDPIQPDSIEAGKSPNSSVTQDGETVAPGKTGKGEDGEVLAGKLDSIAGRMQRSTLAMPKGTPRK